MIQPIIRAIKPTETAFLSDMLYEALYIPNGEPKLPQDIIYQPQLFAYIKGFGQQSDMCLVAEWEKQLIGAIWIRLFTEEAKGYGFVNEQTPELSMALLENYQNKGIGTQLLKKMIEKLTDLKYKHVSLSVDKRNFAYNMYKKHHFKEIHAEGNSIIMIKFLNI